MSFDPKSLMVSELQHSFTHVSLVSPMLQEGVLISAVPSALPSVSLKQAITPLFVDFGDSLRN